MADTGVKPGQSSSRGCGPNHYTWEGAIGRKKGNWGAVLSPAVCLAEGIRHMTSLTPHVYSNTTGVLTSLASEETKAQRSQFTCPKPHSQKMVKLEIRSNPTLPD